MAERAALVRGVGALHAARREQLAGIIAREMGKPLEQGLGEVDFCRAIYDYYADNGESLMADEPITLSDGEGSAFIRRSSIGALLGIMPWNYPYYQVARFAGPNLVVGNTILLKHAPQCPESAEAIAQMFRDAGFPEGAYTNIFATNEQIATVIADPRVQGVSVTGSERAGAAVAEIAGRNLKKVVLELGGADPFILLSTDDLDEVVGAAVAARLENAGQACNAAKRFVVADALYEPFVERLTAALRAVEPGDPAADGTAMGPLSSTTAADRLEDQLKRAVAGGAKLVGGDREGNFIEPGVLTGVKPGNGAARDRACGHRPSTSPWREIRPTETLLRQPPGPPLVSRSCCRSPPPVSADAAERRAAHERCRRGRAGSLRDRAGAPNGRRTSGTSPWKFSRIASSARSVTAVPFSVCTKSVPCSPRKRIRSRRAWKSVVFEADVTSR